MPRVGEILALGSGLHHCNPVTGRIVRKPIELVKRSCERVTRFMGGQRPEAAWPPWWRVVATLLLAVWVMLLARRLLRRARDRRFSTGTPASRPSQRRRTVAFVALAGAGPCVDLPRALARAALALRLRACLASSDDVISPRFRTARDGSPPCAQVSPCPRTERARPRRCGGTARPSRRCSATALGKVFRTGRNAVPRARAVLDAAGRSARGSGLRISRSRCR